MGGAASGAPFTRILPLSLETFLKHQCNGVCDTSPYLYAWWGLTYPLGGLKIFVFAHLKFIRSHVFSHLGKLFFKNDVHSLAIKAHLYT